MKTIAADKLARASRKQMRWHVATAVTSSFSAVFMWIVAYARLHSGYPSSSSYMHMLTCSLVIISCGALMSIMVAVLRVRQNSGLHNFIFAVGFQIMAGGLLYNALFLWPPVYLLDRIMNFIIIFPLPLTQWITAWVKKNSPGKIDEEEFAEDHQQPIADETEEQR